MDAQEVTHSDEEKEKVEQVGKSIRSYLLDQLSIEPTNMWEGTDWTTDNRELTLVEYRIEENTYIVYWRVAIDNSYEIYSEDLHSVYIRDTDGVVEYFEENIL